VARVATAAGITTSRSGQSSNPSAKPPIQVAASAPSAAVAPPRRPPTLAPPNPAIAAIVNATATEPALRATTRRSAAVA
jgi:hypothetical protein